MMLQGTKRQVATVAKDMIFFLVGSIICSISIKCFAAPNQIAPGGLTGFATVLNHLFQTPIGAVSFILNIPIFIWGMMEIGYKLIIKTFFATLATSIAIDLIGYVVPAYHGNVMLAAVFCGVLDGIGLSLVFMRGGTTGGSDMVARLLGRHFRHVSMGKLMLSIDLVIIVFSAIAYKSLESALYAMIAIFVCTRIIDAILYGTAIGNGKVLFIISRQNNEIAQRILSELTRGVTALKSRGVYSGRDGEVLLCAVRRYEVCKITDIVNELDPSAFIIMGEAGEITGEGFREIKPEDKPLKELLMKNKKEQN